MHNVGLTTTVFAVVAAATVTATRSFAIISAIIATTFVSTASFCTTSVFCFCHVKLHITTNFHDKGKKLNLSKTEDKLPVRGCWLDNFSDRLVTQTAALFPKQAQISLNKQLLRARYILQVKFSNLLPFPNGYLSFGNRRLRL